MGARLGRMGAERRGIATFCKKVGKEILGVGSEIARSSIDKAELGDGIQGVLGRVAAVRAG